MLPDELFNATDLFLANWNAKEDIVVNQGGTSSGKTYALLQCIFRHAYEEPNSILTIAGQDLPNLKVGAIRDAEEIVSQSERLQSLIQTYNKSDYTYHFRNGSIIEFKSYANAQDAKSGKREYLFMNEANGLTWDIWQELNIRTAKKSYLDYNPNEEFWVHEKLIGGTNVLLIISDHRHNAYVAQKIRDKIEALKDQDIELWKVYARGQTGKIEGLIFRNTNIVEGVPYGAKLISSGLDFGFTNDPTSFVQIYDLGGELYVDELIYETRLTNPDISAKLRQFGVSRNELIYADSAEPKSIQEILNEGFNIQPVQKGPDSVKMGISILWRYKINITSRSTGLRREIQSYKWKVGKDGKPLNEPIDLFNHSIDAMRYAAVMTLGHLKPGNGEISIW